MKPMAVGKPITPQWKLDEEVGPLHNLVGGTMVVRAPPGSTASTAAKAVSTPPGDDRLWAMALNEYASSDRPEEVWAKLHARHQADEAMAKSAYLSNASETWPHPAWLVAP